ncbi:glycosyltransferase family 39 protein (plasmid) [Haladaptatus sp. SPP-AMP-3]|uniref:hypothetical protein n=1 Tax=Haladaptatus sp. SPP-AMP-3 TaxID=3121295 RepID=UPI003C2D0967
MNFRSVVTLRSADVLKVITIVASWILLATSISVHLNGRLYPSLTVGVGAVTVLFVAYVVSVGSFPTRYLLAALVCLSVYYRALVVLFPSSYVGVDPDKYAGVIVSLMETGRVVNLDFPFYGKAPFFLVSGALTGDVMGVDALRMLDVYAFVFGALFPLLAYVVARRLSSERVGIYATLLVAVGAASVIYATSPLAQTLAVGLWIPFLVVFGRYLRYKRTVDLVLTFLFTVAMVYTHKLTALLVFGTVVGSSAFILLQSREWMDDPIKRATTPSTLLMLTVLSGVLVVVQLTIITDYIVGVIGRFLLALQVTSVETVHVVPRAATPVASEPVNFVLRRGHGLTLVPLAGIAWLVLARRTDSHETRAILAGIAVCIALTGVGAVSVSAVNPSRMYFYMELLLFVVVAVAVLRRHVPGRRRSVAVLAVFLLLVTSQLITPLVVPDHPQGERQYLTAEETAAKRFSTHVPGDIATDFFYAKSTVRLHNPRPTRLDDPSADTYMYMDEELLNHTTLNEDTRYIAYRTQVRVYRTYGAMQGRWELTYDPEPGFDRRHERVYSNGGVVVYRR